MVFLTLTFAEFLDGSCNPRPLDSGFQHIPLDFNTWKTTLEFYIEIQSVQSGLDKCLYLRKMNYYYLRPNNKKRIPFQIKDIKIRK